MTGFSSKVRKVVATIPKGRVMTYGQIASVCGSPRAARIVGGIAHYGDSSLPWHRVVNKYGGLASGYPGGKKGQQLLLESEGYKVTNFMIDIEKCIWAPKIH